MKLSFWIPASLPFLLILLIPYNPAVAANNIVINELVPHTSPLSDWVELYNPTSTEISLSGWTLKDTTSTMKTLSGSIAAASYLVVNVYNRLDNSGDNITLNDSNGNLIDSYNYSLDPGVNISLGRIPDGSSWTTLTNSSPGSTNGNIPTTPTLTSSPTPTAIPTATPTSQPTIIPSSTPTITPNPQPTFTPSPTKTSTVFTISTDKTSISTSQSLFTQIQISHLQPNNSYYLKGAFYKEGSTNYFGLTKVGGVWIKNSSTYSTQLPISTDTSGSWTGTLEIMADTDDSGFTGSGNYILKIRRYNANGGEATWSNTVQMEITSSTSSNSSDALDNISTTSPTSTPPAAPSNLLQIVKTKMNLSPKKISTSSGTKIPLSLLPQSASVAGSSSVSAQLLSTNSERKGDTFITLGIIFLILGSASLVYLKKTR